MHWKYAYFYIARFHQHKDVCLSHLVNFTISDEGVYP